MPDISMCENKDCPSRNECYRFMADPNPYRQSYSDFKPEAEQDKCDYFMKLWKKQEPLK